MNRKLRTTIPISRHARKPDVPDYSTVQRRDEREKQRQTENFNSRHGVRDLSTLSPGDAVYLPDRESSGTVVSEAAPRSYVVQTPEGTVRRNRRHMVPLPQRLATSIESNDSAEFERHDPPEASTSATNSSDNTQVQTQEKVYPTRSRSGRGLRAPDRLDNSWD